MLEGASTPATGARLDPRSRGGVLREGDTCWRIEEATRLAFLIDGAEYFGAVRAALTQAQRSFFVLGWDFDSRMRLVPAGAKDGFAEPLGAFLNQVVASRPELRGYVLTWDYAMLYALEREWLPIFGADWRTHRRLSLHFDDQHPVGASHHQKVIVVDDEVAFVSGFDLAGSRWDTSDHVWHNPQRVNAAGEAYAPFHDVGVMVSGNCARALGALCRERWLRATGRMAIAPSMDAAGHDPWPDQVIPALTNVDVAIARTSPSYDDHGPVDEVRRMHLAAIASARKSIFIENQYFTSPIIADALSQSLLSADGPDVAVVAPMTQSGWLEASTMGVLRARIHRLLRAADGRGRYRLYCPTRPGGDCGDACINVHSKVLIADDEFLTIGSANLANRSLCLDTECNLAIEAGGDPRLRRAIAGLRERLLGEHLGVSAAEVANAMRENNSLHGAIESLQSPGSRHLAITEPPLDATIDALTPEHDVLDPERPLDPEVLLADLVPEPEVRRTLKLRTVVIVGLVIVLAFLAVAWKYTTLGTYFDVETLAAEGTRIRDRPWMPFAVPIIFVVAGFAVVPVMLLIAVTVGVFGPLLGGLLAFAGAMASAAASYAVGRKLARNMVRRIAGPRLNELSRRLGKRGLLAMLVVRLVPVAPYTIVNLVAGASHVGWRDYLLGTGLGLLPGLVVTTAFVDRAIAAIRAPGPGTLAALALALAAIMGLAWAIHRSFRGDVAARAGNGRGSPVGLA